MSGVRVPTDRRELDEMKREIANLRALLARKAPFPTQPGQIIFSWSGVVSGARLSGPWPTPLELTITSFVTGYTVTSSSTTDLNFYVDGVLAHSWSHPAGSESQFEPVRFIVPQGSRCQLHVTGDDGEEFTCFVGFSRTVVG